MTNRVTLGLVGLLAVGLVAGGLLVGGLLFQGGALLGFFLGAAASGWLLRSYFVRRERAVDGG